MVDFQSRDTNRGRTTHEPDDDGDDEADETTASTDDPSSTDGDVSPGEADGASVSAAVVTVSDTRTHEDDPGGDAVVEALESAGHAVATREVLRTAHDSVQQTVDTLTGREDVTAVVTTGGTGVAPRDVTIEAVHPLVDKGLPGFGEEFRRRYAEAVGTDALGTRATAGVVDGTPVFCLPGDPEAARIGTAELVAEQAARLARLATGDEAADP